MNKHRWIQLSVTPAERAVLESALQYVKQHDPEKLDHYDLADDTGHFVYAGDLYVLDHALATIRENHNDPAAEDVRHRVQRVYNEQENSREETNSE